MSGIFFSLLFERYKWSAQKQFYKMVTHTQTIRWQIANELFKRVWSFCGIGA